MCIKIAKVKAFASGSSFQVLDRATIAAVALLWVHTSSVLGCHEPLPCSRPTDVKSSSQVVILEIFSIKVDSLAHRNACD